MKIIKYDWSKYNPEALEKRGIEGKSLERLYSRLRKEVYNRIYTLKKSGYGNIEEVKKMPLRTLESIKKEVPAPDYYMRRRISDFVNFLNDPLTLARNQPKRTEIKAIRTLNNKYDLNLKSDRDLKRFGDYMQYVRNMMEGLEFDSDDAVQRYVDEKISNKVNAKKLAEAFTSWEKKDTEKARDNLKKMFPDNYKDKWKEYGLDDTG